MNKWQVRFTDDQGVVDHAYSAFQTFEEAFQWAEEWVDPDDSRAAFVYKGERRDA